MIAPTKLKRRIFFYSTKASFKKEYAASFGEGLVKVFNDIDSLHKARNKHRFVPYNDRMIGLVVNKIDSQKRLIEGKIRSVRTDFFPQLIDTDSDKERDIEAAANEGILEVTHFSISYNDQGANVAIEYNHYGAKVHEIGYFIKAKFGSVCFDVGDSLQTIILTRDELPRLQARMKRCTEFTVKVHQDNFEKIKALDGKLYSALEESIKYYDCESAYLKLRFDLNKAKPDNSIKASIEKLISKILQKRERADLFEELLVRAEDSDKADRLSTFDLLVDKIRSDVQWEHRPKSRVVLSSGAFESLAIELSKKRLIKIQR